MQLVRGSSGSAWDCHALKRAQFRDGFHEGLVERDKVREENHAFVIR